MFYEEATNVNKDETDFPCRSRRNSGPLMSRVLLGLINVELQYVTLIGVIPMIDSIRNKTKLRTTDMLVLQTGAHQRERLGVCSMEIASQV